MKNAAETLIKDEMNEEIISAAEKLAVADGASTVTVRRILQALGITNRVFYNRFHNIDEVLEIVYERIIVRIRAGILSGFDPDGDYFSQIISIGTETIKLSYEHKMNLNQYIFESDSASQSNYYWWKNEIAKLIEFGKAKNYIEDVDTEAVGYSIWCFIRGYNADAVGRGIPLETAIKNFKYSFSFMLEGMKKRQ
ncbi:MAG: TetR/AcrR family transcriptional regulator [Clostridia bacterium]|nr:TetR/AcrR family transcriptional regulator [Clostridia bacterium]